MLSILQRKEFCFNDYDYNSYIDIFEDINWFRLPGKGVKFQLCGHIWSREFKGCLEVEKHKGTKAEDRMLTQEGPRWFRLIAIT